MLNYNVKTKMKSEWDYLGWKNIENSPYTQSEWDITLVSKINQLSAIIFQATMTGGADTIHINPENFKIMKNIPFLNLNELGYNLGGRYKIILDEKCPINRVFVSRTRPIPENLKVNKSKLIGYIDIKNYPDSLMDLHNAVDMEHFQKNLYRVLKNTNNVLIDEKTDLEYLFNKYKASVDRGKPNQRAANNLKLMIDTIQTKYEAESRIKIFGSDDYYRKFILPFGDKEQTIWEWLVSKIKKLKP